MKVSSSSEHEAVVARHTSTAVEETSKKSNNPDTRANIRQRAGEAAADKMAGRDANAVDANQLAKNQISETSWPVMARERTHSLTRKKAKSSAPRRKLSSFSDESSSSIDESSSSIDESSSSIDELSSSIDESSSASSKLSFYTCESSFDTDELNSSSDSKTVMAWHAKMAKKKTSAKAREKKTQDELKENILMIQRRHARERPSPSSRPLPWVSSGRPP